MSLLSSFSLKADSHPNSRSSSRETPPPHVKSHPGVTSNLLFPRLYLQPPLPVCCVSSQQHAGVPRGAVHPTRAPPSAPRADSNPSGISHLISGSWSLKSCFIVRETISACESPTACSLSRSPTAAAAYKTSATCRICCQSKKAPHCASPSGSPPPPDASCPARRLKAMKYHQVAIKSNHACVSSPRGVVLQVGWKLPVIERFDSSDLALISYSPLHRPLCKFPQILYHIRHYFSILL